MWRSIKTSGKAWGGVYDDTRVVWKVVIDGHGFLSIEVESLGYGRWHWLQRCGHSKRWVFVKSEQSRSYLGKRYLSFWFILAAGIACF